MLLAANNDRVRESTATVGAGDLALLGAVVGFRAFSAVLNDQDVRPYTIEGLNSGGGPSGEWETGLGTYNAGLNTLSRTTVLASSNAGAAVVFSAGAKQVWIDAPAAFLSGLLQAGNNLADVANVATARHSLGLDAVDAPTFAGLTLTGHVLALDGTAAIPAYSFAAEPGTGIRRRTGNTLSFVNQNVEIAQMVQARFACIGSIGIASGDLATISPDVNLFRDAANILALRNGVNAQAFRLYNTFTDLSNNEYLQMVWSGNTAFLTVLANGTGTARSLVVGTNGATALQFRTNSVSRWQVDANGNIQPSAAGATGATANFSAILSAAGPPTGVPTNTVGVALYYDTTNNKLYAYNGAWKGVVLA